MLPNNPSNATLWVLDTCLIIRLLPLTSWPELRCLQRWTAGLCPENNMRLWSHNLDLTTHQRFGHLLSSIWCNGHCLARSFPRLFLVCCWVQRSFELVVRYSMNVTLPTPHPINQEQGYRSIRKPASSRTSWTRSSGCVAHRPGATQHLPDAGAYCVSPAVTSGSWVSLCSDQRLLHREDVLLLEAKKAVGEWRTGSLKPKPPVLVEACARSHASSVMGTWMIPPRQFFWERSLHKEEADSRHRAGVTADLTPAEAEGKNDAGFGPGLEADELGHESFGTVQFVLDFAEAEVWGSRMDLTSCGGFGQGVLGKGFRWKLFAFCCFHFEASIILPSLETSQEGLSGRPPFRRRERKQSSPGGCCRSQIVLNPHRCLPRDRRRRTVGLQGRLVALLLCSGPSVGQTVQSYYLWFA